MGATNSAQIYRIPIVQLETIPVDQSSLGGVVAYFNNLGEKLYAELGNHSNQSDLNWEERYSEANRLPKFNSCCPRTLSLRFRVITINQVFIADLCSIATKS